MSRTDLFEAAAVSVDEDASEVPVEEPTEEPPPPSGSRVFHPRELAAGKAAPEPARPATPARPQFFQSWKRAEELREQAGPIEYEDVGSVSEFESNEPVAPPLRLPLPARGSPNRRDDSRVSSAWDGTRKTRIAAMLPPSNELSTSRCAR